MGELLDRGFQREVLHTIANDYPGSTDIEAAFGTQGNNFLKVNLAYLREHGLVNFSVHGTKDDQYPMPIEAVITARGLDFLADDGGLSAILGAVTIRFDEAQIRDLLLQRVALASGDDTMKSELIEIIKQMPAEGLRELASRAISYGIEKAPDGIETLKAFFNL
ncbi:hypothetical protein [uncultured Ruegeria sp.]|uniref:hypothetical protein n=1 Tax=uncultured Ruegeria sp. TaxID=259304 RepID=UPI00261CA8AF|nr:hypothetical protein [uncultured Ruegeria sp.]